MLSPKRTKYRKPHKHRFTTSPSQQKNIRYGRFGLKALQSGYITARQIEAARRAMTRKFQRKGRLWIRIFPDHPITKKPAEVRMGKGKGSPQYWAKFVKPGEILFELSLPLDMKGNMDTLLLKEVLLYGIGKLPIKSKICQLANL